jgi:hypothetical protein
LTEESIFSGLTHKSFGSSHFSIAQRNGPGLATSLELGFLARFAFDTVFRPSTIALQIRSMKKNAKNSKLYLGCSVESAGGADVCCALWTQFGKPQSAAWCGAAVLPEMFENPPQDGLAFRSILEELYEVTQDQLSAIPFVCHFRCAAEAI